jgi:hypothetical protein
VAAFWSNIQRTVKTGAQNDRGGRMFRQQLIRSALLHVFLVQIAELAAPSSFRTGDVMQIRVARSGYGTKTFQIRPPAGPLNLQLDPMK